jgi:lipoate-protein ligase A
MSRDEAFFLAAENNSFGQILLRFYSWQKPAISFGYRQKIEELVDIKKAAALGIELISRITGGGMVCHQPGELTYCLVAPLDVFPGSTLSACRQISEIIISGLQKVGVSAVLASRQGIDRADDDLCFARPTKYEVLANGKKLVGSAQKRGRQVLMQHGSIALEKMLPVFAELLNIENEIDQISIEEILKRKVNYREVAKVIGEEFNLFSYSACS